MTRNLRLLVAIPLAIGIVAVALLWTRSRTPATAGRDASTTAVTSTGPVAEIVRASRKAPPVIFLGLDGADWQLLDQYIAEGVMPNLAKLTAEGTAGTLETMHPALSPLIWTSMMTGASPLRHRILDFVRFEPASGRKEPITSDERKVPAIWNMASFADRSVAVFGMWATYPAEPATGLMVSDRLFTFLFKEERPPGGIVSPSSEEGWARSIVERAQQAVGLSELKQYLPWMTEADYSKALESADLYTYPPSALRRTLIETRVYDDLAKEWLRRRQPDLTVVYLQGTDTIGHTFAAFAPPRLPTTSNADYERYSSVPRKYFSYVDRLIGDYRRIAEQSGARIMIASDHGFTWTDGRPTSMSSYAHATASKWHRKHGVYVLWGPGIASRDVRDAKASVLQTCATLLALMGLPAGRDIEGAPFPGTPSTPADSSTSSAQGPSTGPGEPPADYSAHFTPAAPAPGTAATRTIDQDALARLRALGYIGAAESSSGRRVEATRSAGSYNNEGLLLRDAGRQDEAITAFENALVVDPNLSSAMWNLSDLLFEQNKDLDRSDLLLVRAFGSRLPEGTKFLIGRAIGYQRNGRIDRSMKLLESALRVRPEEPEVWLFSGRYRVERGDCAGGVSDMEKAARLAPATASVYASLGIARICAGDRDGARRDLRRSLEIDPAQPAVRAYLAKLGSTGTR